MGSREKFNEAIVQLKNVKKNPEATKIEEVENAVNGKPKCHFGRVYWIAQTLRVVQILVLVALLTLTIYLMIKKDLSTNLTGILLIALFVTYLFVLIVDIISLRTIRTLPDTPMFLFGVLGFLLFSAATEGVYMILWYPVKPDDLLLAIMILCGIEAILFLLDVTFIILNWRQACMRVDKCPSGTPVCNVTPIYRPGDNYFGRKIGTSDPFVFKRDVHDVTTSISDYQRPSHPDLTNLHKYRKIGVGQRRQYIDRPIDARSAISLKVDEVQTEPPQRKAVSDVESLIIPDVREETAQTIPKCPVCANSWDPHGALHRIDNFGLCPTFLHLAQGFGMCNCSRPTSGAVRPIPLTLRTESTSATDFGVLRKTQKSDSQKNSNPKKK